MLHLVLSLALGGAPLTIDQAVQRALDHHPRAAEARATREAAEARTAQALTGLLPQLDVAATYRRTTSNFIPQPGALPADLQQAAAPTFDTDNFTTAGASASWRLWDFGQTWGLFRSASASASAASRAEDATRADVVLTARLAFLDALAQRALVKVAEDALATQQRHLDQAAALASIGARGEIDVLQAKADRATAHAALLQAQSAEQIARWRLAQAMGEDAPPGEALADVRLEAPPEEKAPVDALLAEAEKARPDLQDLAAQVEAQRAQAGALRGSWFPALSAAGALQYAGPDPRTFGWNFYGGLNLTWSPFAGGGTWARASEADAIARSLEARLRALRAQVRVQVQQVASEVATATAVLADTRDANASASGRLRLAERRYELGSSTFLELSDARLQATTAAANLVRADFAVSTARARWLQAVGR